MQWPIGIISSAQFGGHIILGSGLFDGSSGRLTYAVSTTGNRKTATWSWVQKGSGLNGPSGTRQTIWMSGNQSQNNFEIYWLGQQIVVYSIVGNVVKGQTTFTPLYRDPAAYQEITVSLDAANTTVKAYSNGEEITDKTVNTTWVDTDHILNYDTTNTQHAIGSRAVYATSYFDGYIARMVYIDGLALTPTSFGSVTDDGFWSLSDVSDLDFGENGVLLTGGSAMAAGTDSSGNSNNFSKIGTITATSDSPTNSDDGWGNYCTLSPLWQTRSGTSKSILSNGNLTVKTNGSTIGEALGSIAADSSGKSTYETTVTAVGSVCLIGFAGSTYIDGNATFRVAWRNNGTVYFGSSSTYSSSDTYTTGDVVRCELNMTTGALQFFKNGTLASDASSPSFAMHTNVQDSGWLPYIGLSTNASSGVTCNFGASSFAATPTSGFLPIATNLPTPAIINPDDHFFSTIIDHDGNDTDGTCTFNLDTYEWLAIIKNTTGAVEKWYWIDSLRGVTKYWSSTDSSAQTTDSNVLTVSGTTFTLGSTLGAKNYLVEFHRAGLASATASNTVGTINTTATSVNTTSGFAIGQYEGTGSNATVGHGLSSTPEFTIHKGVDNAENSVSWHTGLTDGTYYVQINTILAQNAAATIWNSTAPSSTVISLGSHALANVASTNMSYAWHSSPIQSFGSYEGNGSATDGPMISVGFHPKCALYKWIDGGDSWVLYDDAFDPINGVGNRIHPNKTNIVAADIKIDRLSNGSKIYSGDGAVNSSSTLIYCYWGGQPMTDGSVNQGRAR